MAEIINCSKIQVNQNVILRDQELFFKKLGIGLFDPSLVDRFKDQVPTTSEERVVWLPNETDEVAQMVDSGQSVLVLGALGSGKSAILYGLRARYRDTNRPYCYIDGHFVDTPPQIIEKKLDWSVQHGALVSWDSMDYLIGKTRKVRKNSVVQHRERSLSVLNLIDQYLRSGYPLVGTSHCEPWISKNCNPEDYNNLWEDITMKMTMHMVRGRFDTPEDAIRFYVHAGFDTTQASYLTNVYHNNEQLAQHESDPLRYLREYRIAKLLALDMRTDSATMRETIQHRRHGDIPEIDLLDQLRSYIENKNEETRAKMGFC